MIEHYKDGTTCECYAMLRNYYPDSRRLMWELPYDHENTGRVYIERQYNRDGYLERKIPYINGKIHGKMIVYHENGVAYQETCYIKDRKTGIEKVYLRNGLLCSMRMYCRDRLLENVKYPAENFA